ncbi:hypothetical protein TNCV_2440491 [Trichonephila clavipes]|nr:hypothetical protein TNCV_2440491 [Trichonephila clavipes]
MKRRLELMPHSGYQDNVRIVNGTKDIKRVLGQSYLDPQAATENIPSKTSHMTKGGAILLSYTRAFDDGPRNFELWSNGVDDT